MTRWGELVAASNGRPEPATFEEAIAAAWRRKEQNYALMAWTAIGFGVLMAAIFALAIILTVSHG